MPFFAELRQNGRKVDGNFTFVQSIRGKREAYVVFPQQGDYALRLFAKRSPSEEAWDLAIEYKVQAQPKQPTDVGFPKSFSVFQDTGAYLYGPARGVLEAGKPQLFRIDVPGATSIGVQTGGQIYPIHMEGYITLLPGEALITAQFPARPGYNYGLVKYIVR